MTAGSRPLAPSPADSGRVPWRFGAVLAVVLAAHAGLWRWALSEAAPPLTPDVWVPVVWRSEGASEVPDAGPSEAVAQSAPAAVATAPEALSAAQAPRPSPPPTSFASPLALSSPPVPRAPPSSAPVEPRAPVAVAQPVSEAEQDLADERPPPSAAPPSPPLASAEAAPRPAKASQATRAQSPRLAPTVDAVAPPPLEVAAPPRPAWREPAPSAALARPVRPEPPPPPRRVKPLPAVVSKSPRPELARSRAAPGQSSPASDRAKPVRRPAMAAQAAPALQQQPPPTAVGDVAARSTALANAPGTSPVATGATSLEAAITPPSALSGRGASPAASPPPAPQPSLRNPKPVYPRISQRLGEQGVVHLRARVNERGRVTAVQVLVSSGHARLDEAALAAVRQWSYEVPAGQEMASQWLEVPIAFALRGR